MEPTNPLLPALRADTPSLLRRAGSLMGAVQGIQQEASAEYWFELGIGYKEKQEWEQARSCFNKATTLDSWYSSAWLLNALANVILENEEYANFCLVQAFIKGVLKSEGWFPSELSIEDWKNIVNSVDMNYLDRRVLHSYRNQWPDDFPFAWSDLHGAKATNFINKVVAASVVAYNDWFNNGSGLWDYHWGGSYYRGHKFTGDYHSPTHSRLLGELISHIFGVDDIFMSTPVVRESNNQSSFSQKDFEILLNVSLHLINSISPDATRLAFDTVTGKSVEVTWWGFNTVWLQEQIRSLNIDNGNTEFYLAQAAIKKGHFNEAVVLFEAALVKEHKFAASDYLWQQLAFAKIHGKIPGLVNREDFIRNRLNFTQTEAEQAAGFLEKAAMLRKDSALIWVNAADIVFWYLRDFSRAITLYKAAFVAMKFTSQSLLSVKLRAVVNCAEAFSELGYESSAKSIVESGMHLVEDTLKIYYQDDDYVVDKLDRSALLKESIVEYKRLVDFVERAVMHSIARRYNEQLQSIIQRELVWF